MYSVSTADSQSRVSPIGVTTGTTAPDAKPAQLGSLDGELRGSQPAIMADISAPLQMADAHDINDYSQTQDLFKSVKERIETVDKSQREMLDSLRRQASAWHGR